MERDDSPQMKDVPVVSAITIEAGGDGIAAVSRALWDVVRGTWGGSCRLVTMWPGPARRPRFADKARFAARMNATHLLGGSRWILFTHLKLLRTLSALPALARPPYAVFLHGLEAWGELPARDEQLLRGARLRLANSRFTAQRVADQHPDVGPVVACPLGLGPDEEATNRETDAAALDLPWAVGDSAVLIVGRMSAAERYKGHDQLIDAFPLVLQQTPRAQLVVVGGGDDVERLRARATERQVAASIVFTGFVSQPVLQALYRRGAVFAMPSLNEGFGLVYLEAMAHRLPCIGSRADAAAEVIDDGRTGILVDQSDIRSLAAQIARLLRDRELRERMGAAGERRLRECFSFERFAGQVTHCLRAAFEQQHTAAAP